MDTDAAFLSVTAVASHLPFSLDETERVNAVFARWRQHGGAEEERLVALWTYCYVRRYFVLKFVRRTYGGVADMDALIEKTYQRVIAGREGIKDPGRYAHWVSVVCRNTFLNYVRSWQAPASVSEDGGELEAPAEESDAGYDRSFLVYVLQQAIVRLPASLQEVVRLRLLQECEYDEISRITGKSPAVVRSYFHKAITRLREDAQLAEALRALEEYG